MKEDSISVLESLFSEKKEIELRIKESLSCIHNKRLRDASAHIINAGGKRIRPSLFVLAYEAVGGKNVKRIIPIAVAIELIHNWALVHDDIIDRSEMRRGVLTVHVKWNKNTALLSGDALNNLAYLLLSKSNIDENVISKIVKVIAETSLELIDGEMMDIEFEKRLDVTEKEYFEMIKKKTGSLIKSATKIGALLGTEDEEKIKALEEYGELIGIAFQIQDDLLDLIGDIRELGKDIGRDIKEGKRTLMVIYTLNNVHPTDADRLIKILSSKNPGQEEIREGIAILKKSDSIKYAQQILLKLIRKIKETLDVLPETERRVALLELADYIITRRK